MEANNSSPTSGDVYPRPDPTRLTSQALVQATAALREILEARIEGQREVLETRLDGMDEAIRLLQTILDRRGVEIDTKIAHLQALHDQKFETVEERFKTVIEQFTGVQTQFAERDVRVRDAALANTTAINAALQSQKEAAGEQAKSFTLSIDKSEKGTLEQISQQQKSLETIKAVMDDKVDDLKDRLTRIESIGAGRIAEVSDTRSAAASHQTSNSFLLALFVAGISLIGLVALLVKDFVR